MKLSMLLAFSLCASLEVCVYQAGKKDLCGEIQSFQTQEETDDYIRNITDSSINNNLILYIAGDTNYTCLHTITNVIQNLTVIGLDRKNTAKLNEFRGTSIMLFENIEIYFGYELLSISEQAYFTNCIIHCEQTLQYKYLNVDLNSLNSMNYFTTEYTVIRMSGKQINTPFIFNSQVVTFVDIPNNTEFVQLSNKLIARLINSSEVFMSVITMKGNKDFIFDANTYAKFTAIAVFSLNETKSYHFYGNFVALEVAGNQWNTYTMYLGNITNSKILINCNTGPNIVNVPGNEIHIAKETYIDVLTTNEIHSDNRESFLTVGCLTVKNTTIFDIHKEMMFLQIKTLVVESDNESIAFKSENFVPVYYPQHVEGVSTISIGTIQFEESTTIQIPSFLCKFDKVSDLSKKYFICDQMMANNSYTIFETESKEFDYEFLLSKETNFNVEVENVNNTIIFKTIRSAYPNRFCNGDNMTENDCYPLSDYEKHVDYNRNYLELIFNEQLSEVPSLSNFKRPINLIIRSYGDVRINQMNENMIQNLTAISMNGRRVLYVESLNLINCTSISFNITGKLKTVYFQGDTIGADGNADPVTTYLYSIPSKYFTVFASNIVQLMVYDVSIVFTHENGLQTFFNSTSIENLIMNISDSQFLEIYVLSSIVFEVNLENCVASYYNTSLITMDKGTKSISTSAIISLSNSYLIVASQFDFGVHLKDLQNCIITNPLGSHGIVRDDIDITRNVTFESSMIEFLGSHTVSTAKITDKCIHRYKHLVVKDFYSQSFETGELTLEKGSMLQAYSSFFHSHDRINITVKTGLDGIPALFIMASEGTGPRLKVEIDEILLDLIYDEEMFEYLSYGIPIAQVLAGENSVLGDDWIFEVSVNSENVAAQHTDAFKVTNMRWTGSNIELLEILPDYIDTYHEEDFAFPTKSWTLESVILLLVVLALALIGLVFLFLNRRKTKDLRVERNMNLENIDKNENERAERIMGVIIEWNNLQRRFNESDLEFISNAFELYLPKSKELSRMQEESLVFV